MILRLAVLLLALIPGTGFGAADVARPAAKPPAKRASKVQPPPAASTARKPDSRPSLKQKLDAILRASVSGQRAFWGVEVRDVKSGTLLYESQGSRLFVPASNAKLFTAALALTRMGPEYRFFTTITADLPPHDGIVKGDLRLTGGGDPSLGMNDIDVLAAQLAAAGVKRIEGDVIGDDSAFLWQPYAAGWEQDDTLWDYGAPVSALTLNENAVALRLRASGQYTTVFLNPPLEHYAIDNRVQAAPTLGTNVRLERLPGKQQIRLWGTMHSPGEVHRLLAIDEPALYAAAALREALTRRGIEVRGRALAQHRYLNQAANGAPAAPPGQAAGNPSGADMVLHESASLADLLRSMEKNSNNLYAEIILRACGRIRSGTGSLDSGLQDLKAFLTEIGITEDQYRFSDGSGLSDLNLVTPAAIVKLLRHMYGNSSRGTWNSLLPTGGQDGTLAERFGDSPLAHLIRAKTGTLGHAAALSGYVDSEKRGTLVFSVLVNNYNCPASEIRGVIDRLALALAE